MYVYIVSPEGLQARGVTVKSVYFVGSCPVRNKSLTYNIDSYYMYLYVYFIPDVDLASCQVTCTCLLSSFGVYEPLPIRIRWTIATIIKILCYCEIWHV